MFVVKGNSYYSGKKTLLNTKNGNCLTTLIVFKSDKMTHFSKLEKKFLYVFNEDRSY